MDLDDRYEDNEKWSVYILKVEPTGFHIGRDVWLCEKRIFQNDSKVLVLSNQKDELLSTEMIKAIGRVSFMGKNRSSVLDMLSLR